MLFNSFIIFLNLSVNNANGGDGKESLNVKFDHDLKKKIKTLVNENTRKWNGDKKEVFTEGQPVKIYST